MAQLLPTEIKRLTEPSVQNGIVQAVPVGTGLQVTWSSGEVSSIDSTTLRMNCPCASCLQQRGDTSHQKPLSAGRSLLRVVKSDASQEKDLRELWTVGKYAIGMRWGDGHDTGIYPYALLRALSQGGSPAEAAQVATQSANLTNQ